MANFDLRKELMEINDKLANLNAMVNLENQENLAINYQILHMSLKDLLKSVKTNFPQFENELMGENLDVIRELSKGCLEYSPKAYREKESQRAKKSSRYEMLNSDNAINVEL